MRALLKALLAVIVFVAAPVYANWCATPGRDGSGAISGIVNTYFPGNASVSAGATSITLGASRGASTPIAAGDLLLVVQMQDATITTTNDSSYGNGTAGGYGNGYSAIQQTGRFEFVRAASAVGVGGGSVTVVGATGAGLVYAYNNAAASASGYRRSFQVIRVPQYNEATVSGTVTAAAWNGATGGIVALDVARRLTFSGGTVSASGLGFRGGAGRGLSGAGTGVNTDYVRASTNLANGSKGEGIVGTPRYVNNQGTLQDIGVEGIPGGSYARGAPGNAGGGGTDGNASNNEENTGGGGGGNAGAGGLGGHGWCASAPNGCDQTGGHPGGAVSGLGATRIVMGGGGGAGTTNNATGTPANGFASSGAAGGGIVIIRAGEIAGTGSVTANGASGNTSVLNDAAGGGGAGGSILMSAVRSVTGTSISASANGGNGGSNTGDGSAHGPGGGGGGGFIASSITISTSVTGGTPGTTQNAGSFGPQYGATSGSGGSGISIVGSAIPGLSSAGECTPTVSTAFLTSPIVPGMPSVLSITVTNNNPTMTLSSMAFTNSFPSGLINAAIPLAAKTCLNAATLTAPANGGSFAVSGGSINAASSCTYTVITTATSTGNKTNTMSAGSVSGNYGGVAASSLAPSSAVLEVTTPLTVVKSSMVYFDPLNTTTNPKAIPGAYVAYTIGVANPGSVPVDTDSILVLDATPANLQLFVSDIPGGTGPVLFQDGSTASGLTYTYSGLASLTDDVEFSSDGGTSWTYVPTVNADLVDPLVTHVRIRPKGTMAAGSSFNLIFGYRIN